MVSSASEKPVSQGENTAGACKSYRPHQRMCADGFPITHHCSGRGACYACGTYRGAPWCMQEHKNLPWWLNESGKPRAPAVKPEPLDNSNGADES